MNASSESANAEGTIDDAIALGLIYPHEARALVPSRVYANDSWTDDYRVHYRLSAASRFRFLPGESPVLLRGSRAARQSRFGRPGKPPQWVYAESVIRRWTRMRRMTIVDSNQARRVYREFQAMAQGRFSRHWDMHSRFFDDLEYGWIVLINGREFNLRRIFHGNQVAIDVRLESLRLLVGAYRKAARLP